MIMSATDKVAWLCTYTPEEIIGAAGFKPFRPVASGDFASSSGYLPANLCPYVRQVLHQLLEARDDDLAGVVLANSCNAMMHLYNVLSSEGEIPVFLLDLPRRVDKKARGYFRSQLEEMADFLETIGGSRIDESSLRKTIDTYRTTTDLIAAEFGSERPADRRLAPGFLPHQLTLTAFSAERAELNKQLRPESAAVNLSDLSGISSEESEVSETPEGAEMTDMPEVTEAARRDEGTALSELSDPGVEGGRRLILTGAQPHREMTDILEGYDLEVFHDHCQGYRYWQKNYARIDESESPFAGLARVYLKKPVCPRFYGGGRRREFYEELLNTYDFAGVIFHNLNFCDYAHYDYLQLKDYLQNKDLPMLNIATELSSGDSGQIRTRLEAFLEMV